MADTSIHSVSIHPLSCSVNPSALDRGFSTVIHYRYTMPTNKKRVIISVSKPVEQALELLAKRDQIPQATKAAHLLETALELEEDRVWDVVAAERDTKNARFVSHKKAWA